jgi:hypothetical protein
MIRLLSHHTNILKCKLALVWLLRGRSSIFYAAASGFCRVGFDKLEVDHEATIFSRFVRSTLLQHMSLFYER